MMGLIALSVSPGPHHLAFIRTLTICAAALALAFSGAHWRRVELTRIGYATLALVAAKLVLEDLRHGHLEFIAASIFLFAVTLIAVPRIARMGH
jgi:predicted tellurium resistance membrane protein TerC